MSQARRRCKAIRRAGGERDEVCRGVLSKVKPEFYNYVTRKCRTILPSLPPNMCSKAFLQSRILSGCARSIHPASPHAMPWCVTEKRRAAWIHGKNNLHNESSNGPGLMLARRAGGGGRGAGRVGTGTVRYGTAFRSRGVTYQHQSSDGVSTTLRARLVPRVHV